MSACCTRRGIVLLLATIAGSFRRVMAQEGKTESFFYHSNKQTFMLNLADKDSPDSGVTHIDVTYNGNAIRITAAEIIAALKEDKIG